MNVIIFTNSYRGVFVYKALLEKNFNVKALISNNNDFKLIRTSEDFYSLSNLRDLLFHEKEHFYDYNISGPDFPSYKKIVREVSQHINNLQVNFSNYNSISDRKLFSLKKVKKDIQWEPEYSIDKGIKDYIDNLG